MTKKKTTKRTAPASPGKGREKLSGLPSGPLREILGRGQLRETPIDGNSPVNPIDDRVRTLGSEVADLAAIVEHNRKETERRFDDLEAWRQRQVSTPGPADGIADAIGVQLTPLVTALGELLIVANVPEIPPTFFHRDEGGAATVSFQAGGYIDAEITWKAGYLAGVKAALDVATEEVERLNG